GDVKPMPSTANSSFVHLKRHLSRSARAWRRCLASGWSPIGARTGAPSPDSLQAVGGPVEDRDGDVMVNADSGLPGFTYFVSATDPSPRSEERRVGKECSCRASG